MVGYKTTKIHQPNRIGSKYM